MPGGIKRFGIAGGNNAPPFVETVTVNGAGTPFEIVTLAGTWHTALRGAPLHVNETVPL